MTCKGFSLPVLLLLMICCATAWQGCKKEKDSKAVTIVNRLDKAVTFDLYGSMEDYTTNNNLLNRQVIAAGENLTLPGNTFEDGSTYYMDWYTEDYYHNNWYNDNYPVTGNRVSISPKPGANTYYLEPAYKGNGRNAFLGGDGTKTSWIAVGAYLYSASTGYSNRWDLMPANERYRQIAINKNFTAQYSRRNVAGTIVNEEMEFMVQQAEVPYIEFKTSDGLVAGSMTGGKLPTAAPPSYASNAVDTVLALFPDSDLLFLMVRQ